MEVKYFYFLFVIANGLSDNCRVKEWIETGREVPNSQYALQLSIVNTDGDATSYFPDTNYDIKIKSKTYPFKNDSFVEFYFTLRNKNETKSQGTLQIREVGTTTFSNEKYCKNRIIDGPSSSSRYNVMIGWQSPPEGSGCIELKAYVKETELRYHVTNLTVCQDPRVKLDHPGEILRNCCACDDGKYELTFEGLWSRYTHPKSFPVREWLAVFPTIMGASHSHKFEFWHPYNYASEGMKQFVETGQTVNLELELKRKRRYIQTIIKFHGVNFQNKTRVSYATIRVSKLNHVVSLVAKIDPSPDWFVGVSSLELCQLDCSWIKKKVFNLYPWDAGVRNGILYEDLEGITEPQDTIQSLNMTWPPPRDGEESPFYDKSNNTHDVRPMARIILTLLQNKKDNEKNCQKSADLSEECVNEWSEWSECGVSCGKGVIRRTRTKKEDFVGDACNQKLMETMPCEGPVETCPKEIKEEDCELTDWSEWSKCEKLCGPEIIARSRNFKRDEYEEICSDKFPYIKLKDSMDCGNPPCPDNKVECLDELYTSWKPWEPCSVTQGKGFKHRRRNYKKSKIGYSECLYQKTECEGKPIDVTFENNQTSIQKPFNLLDSSRTIPSFCYLDPDSGECPNNRNENSHKFFYDQASAICKTFSYSGCGGNENKFNYEKECQQICARKVDCQMSEWSNWSKCKDCSDTSHRSKTPVVESLNGGKECPKFNIKEKRSCEKVLTNKCKIKKT